MSINNNRFVLWGGPVELAVVALGIAFWLCVPHRAIQHYPPAVRKAMKAAVAAWRYGETPEQGLKRYLEIQFGPMDNPANRQKAFLSFIDADHVRAYCILMKDTPADANKANVAAAVRWVAQYRQGLSPADKSNLREALSSPAGQAMVREGTSQYESTSANFRGLATPVMDEVLTTLKDLKQ